MLQFIYLVHEREFIRLNENTYKVGKMQGTDAQEYTNKIPRGSQMMLLIPVHNNKALEKEIIALFNEKYQQMDEYGRKYFSGDAQEMIKDISTKIGYYKLTGKQKQERKCTSCGKTKDKSNFEQIGEGYFAITSVCDSCKPELIRMSESMHKDRCSKCSEYKDVSEFDFSNGIPFVGKSICVACGNKGKRICAYCKERKHRSKITPRGICNDCEQKYEDMEKEGVKTVLRCQACATMKDISEYNPMGDDERVRDSICSVCRGKINAGHPTKIQCIYCGKYKHTSQIIESKYMCMECNDKYPSVKKKQNLFKQFIGKSN